MSKVIPLVKISKHTVVNGADEIEQSSKDAEIEIENEKLKEPPHKEIHRPQITVIKEISEQSRSLNYISSESTVMKYEILVRIYLIIII